MMISFSHPTIENMKKAVKEIFGNEKLVAERYVSSKDKDMLIDIIGRVDYESNTKIGEAKTKPPTIKKKRGKDEYYMASTQLPNDPDPMHISQVAFYLSLHKQKTFFVLCK
jgi:predicted RecB family nuclease